MSMSDEIQCFFAGLCADKLARDIKKHRPPYSEVKKQYASICAMIPISMDVDYFYLDKLIEETYAKKEIKDIELFNAFLGTAKAVIGMSEAMSEDEYKKHQKALKESTDYLLERNEEAKL